MVAQRNAFFLFVCLFFPGVKYRRIYDLRSYDHGVVVVVFVFSCFSE